MKQYLVKVVASDGEFSYHHHAQDALASVTLARTMFPLATKISVEAAWRQHEAGAPAGAVGGLRRSRPRV